MRFSGDRKNFQDLHEIMAPAFAHGNGLNFRYYVFITISHKKTVILFITTLIKFELKRVCQVVDNKLIFC